MPRSANALRLNQKAERVPNYIYPVSFPQNFEDMRRKQNKTDTPLRKFFIIFGAEQNSVYGR